MRPEASVHRGIKHNGVSGSPVFTSRTDAASYLKSGNDVRRASHLVRRGIRWRFDDGTFMSRNLRRSSHSPPRHSARRSFNERALAAPVSSRRMPEAQKTDRTKAKPPMLLTRFEPCCAYYS